VDLALDAIRRAANEKATIVCLPEVFIPGYREAERAAPPIDPAFLERAWTTLADTAAKTKVAVVVGTERVVDDRPRISTLVINADGTRAGFQDKEQLDPSEEWFYAPGSERRVFDAGPLRFGIAICHEGFRYPETVRWAARRGAHVVFHPHFYGREPGASPPTTFADPANTFHEKAILCRAAENTCYVASVNYAIPGSATTSFVAKPDGTPLAWQPYGKEGLLVVDIETDQATGFLASRLKPERAGLA
jgi:predicted amidohydrolase